VVSVSSSGAVKGLSHGTATITAAAGGRSASCKVTVTNLPAASAAVLSSGSGSTTVKVNLSAGASLPKNAVAVAVTPGSGRPADVKIARLGTDGLFVFPARLSAVRKIFLMDPDTLIPLAAPSILK